MAEFWPVNEPFVMWVFSKLNPAKPGPICPALLPRVTVAVPITVDPENGTPGFGWAMARNSRMAKEQALSNCRDTAGPTRQDKCVIGPRDLWCDGSAK